MKRTSKFFVYSFILMSVILTFTVSCKKDEESNTTNTSNNVPATVSDVDGNVYHTVTIGTQVWLKENLNTKKYRNGDAIANVTDNTAWKTVTTGAYCNYNNTSNADSITTFGKLYNWIAVNDSRSICPTGYHVPTNADWNTLATYLGGDTIAGGKLKEIGLTHWKSPNEGATNSTGFTALPSGYRHYSGSFYNVGWLGYWWTSNKIDSVYSYSKVMYYQTKGIDQGADDKKINSGLAVRCVKD